MINHLRTAIILTVLVSFLGTSIQMPAYAQIDPMPFMPTPGMMVHLSPQYTPAYLKGIVIHPENALKFDFIIYKGDKPLTDSQKREEYTKLTKYFLASLAIPDNDQWVNLSPYEKDRIIKDDFGKTEMGRDLLAQDYLLKQITASLIYPQDSLGKKFWDKIYSKAQRLYGTTNVPVNTFNKVWILPDDALIYEKGNTAYVLKNHLRVMLEEDYLSLQKHSGIGNVSSPNVLIGDPGVKTHSIASKIIKEIVLPELQREVNEDANFAPLRQVYSGMLLATWFKRTLKQSLLGQIYANKAKVRGVDQDPKTNEAIYRQYLAAYKKGVFNFIKEDTDRLTNETIPRKYFSGGEVSYDLAMRTLGREPIKKIKTLIGNQAMVVETEIKNDEDLAQVAMNVANPAMMPSSAHVRDAAMAQWDDQALRTWFNVFVPQGDKMFQSVSSEAKNLLIGILNSDDSNTQKRKKLAPLIGAMNIKDKDRVAYDLPRVPREVLGLRPQNYSIVDLSIRHMVTKGTMSSEEAQAYRKYIEEMIGHIRGEDPMPGFEPLVNADEVRQLGMVLAKEGLGFVFSDGLGYVNSYYPQYEDAFSAANFRGILVAKDDNLQKLKFIPQIVLGDVPRAGEARTKTIDHLNVSLYPTLWAAENPDFMAELRQDDSPIAYTFLASLKLFAARQLPPPGEESAKRFAKTLFFHEIGEVLYETLPAALKNEWKTLLATPGTRPRPGIIIFKDNLKAGQQAETGLGPKSSSPELFADYFAVFFYPDNVYTAYGEEFPDAWRKYIEKVRTYLQQKHARGRNVFEVDDKDLIRQTVSNQTYILESEWKDLFSNSAMRAEDKAMNSRQVQEHITRAYWALHRVRQIELKVGKNAGNVVNELLKEARDQLVQLVPLYDDRVWKLWAYLMNSDIALTDDQQWKTVYDSLRELNDHRPLAEPGESDIKLNSETQSQELSMRLLSVIMHFKQARVILPGPEKQQVTIRRESKGVYFIDPFKLSRGGVEIKNHGSDKGFMFGIQKSSGKFLLINEVKKLKITVKVDGQLIAGENDKYGVHFTPELPPQGANIDITFSRLTIHLRFQGGALFLREAFKIPAKKDIIFIIGGENVLQIDLPFYDYDNLGFLSFGDHPLQLFYTPFDAAMGADRQNALKENGPEANPAMRADAMRPEAQKDGAMNKDHAMGKYEINGKKFELDKVSKMIEVFQSRPRSKIQMSPYVVGSLDSPEAVLVLPRELSNDLDISILEALEEKFLDAYRGDIFILQKRCINLIIRPEWALRF
jgi:hypothetical protein